MKTQTPLPHVTPAAVVGAAAAEKKAEELASSRSDGMDHGPLAQS